MTTVSSVLDTLPESLYNNGIVRLLSESFSVSFAREKEGYHAMSWFLMLFRNQFLITSLASWFLAQVIKVCINAILTKKIVWERFVGDGGMPSAHSATVSSLAMMSGLVYGLNSFQFAVTAILAVIVTHDAMGVRRETGKQTIVINEILDAFERMKMGYSSSDIALKEFVGHTPLQVAVGIGLGIANALFMYFVVYHG